ncbi:MAG: four helix bundle protein [Planctomycetota bacterium]|nr:four helix bundle protein [Planctomycetota bacterium]
MEAPSGRSGGPPKYAGADTATFDKLHGFKNLITWQKADDLALLVRNATSRFPWLDRRLVSDMRGASVSVASNIAEGYGRAALGDYIHHCEIARGSQSELGSQVQHCERSRLLGGTELHAILAVFDQACYFLDRLLTALNEKRESGQWDRKFWIKEQTAEYLADARPPKKRNARPRSSRR